MKNYLLTREEENSLFKKYNDHIEFIFSLLTNCSCLFSLLTNCSCLDEFLLSHDEQDNSKLVNAAIGRFLKNIRLYECTCGKNCHETLKQEITTLNFMRNKIILSNMGLVHSYVKVLLSKKATWHFEHDDLIQLGLEGLCLAIDKYDFSRGLKFNTYAMWWIKGNISNALRDWSRTVRVPRNKSSKGETTHCIDLDDYKLELALNDSVSEECFSVLFENHQLSKIALKIISKLDERSKLVISMRFGLPPFSESTLDEIAPKLKVSRERVRQIQMKTLDKLVKQLEIIKAL